MITVYDKHINNKIYVASMYNTTSQILTNGANPALIKSSPTLIMKRKIMLIWCSKLPTTQKCEEVQDSENPQPKCFKAKINKATKSQHLLKKTWMTPHSTKMPLFQNQQRKGKVHPKHQVSNPLQNKKSKSNKQPSPNKKSKLDSNKAPPKDRHTVSHDSSGSTSVLQIAGKEDNHPTAVAWP